ncbi:MAG: acetoin utilization protein AcuC [Coriobacteriia bacterium]|nr:acetoin utilization protein AcuC [Coriobacteriia bacterium]
METALVYDARLAAYDLGSRHPLRPERVTRSVERMSAYGLLGTTIETVAPRAASDEELLRIHTREYVEAVKKVGATPDRFFPAHGIGTPDTPAFSRMHEASALVAGAGIIAMEAVMGGRYRRSFSVAGGLHHAHRDHAAGFCVYNDVAVSIAHALAQDPHLHIAYIDIDAHHGDGVQEAFYAEPRVLTFSVHESGHFLFPGTGFPDERGEGAGLGTAFNLPLPPGATDACYRLAFERAIAPAVRAFHPDLIALQGGADAHHSDPLTSLGLTLTGYRWLVESVVRLADELCDGHIVAFGGGGYSWEDIVPRAWTMLAGALADVELPDALAQDDKEPLPADAEKRLLDEVEATIARLVQTAP